MSIPIDLALLRRLNLKHLVSFLAIAEHQSFRLAADRLNLSQSALSVQIRQLEEALGVPLFHRTTRSVVSTEEGNRLLPVAQLLVNEVCLIARDFREEAELHKGSVTVVSIQSVACCLIPDVIQSLEQAYPGVQVHLLVKESSVAVADTVRRGDADVGLLNITQDRPKDLTFTKLFEDDFVAVVPDSYTQLAGLQTTTLRRLSSLPFLIPPRGTFIREALETNLQEQNILIDIRMEVIDSAVLVALVSRGLGLAILPRGVLAPLNLSGTRLIKLRSVPSRTVGLVTAVRRSASPSVTLLQRFIVEGATSMQKDRHRVG